MYSKCGSMQHARDVFDKLPQRNVVNWNSLLLGYVENGESSVTMSLLSNMDSEPDSVTYIAALKALASLAIQKQTDKQFHLVKGVALHQQAREGGFHKDILLANTLVDMYSKCGSMQHAKEVFDEMHERTAVTWNCLILGYVENGENLVALDLFMSVDCEPNSVTFVAALRACASLAAEKSSMRQFCIEKGMAIHRQARKMQFDSNVNVASTLVDMYSKCGSMQYARDVFDSMPHRTVVTWNCLLLGYVENNDSNTALDLFGEMDRQPNPFTFAALVKACASLACLQKGLVIHELIKERGFDSDIYIVCSLVDMYSKCSSMSHARNTFEKTPHRNVVLWTCLIQGYVENGESLVALELFKSMDCEPNCVTFVAALKACAALGSEKHSERQFYLDKGMSIHKQAREAGHDTNITVASTLVDMYGKCGIMSLAGEIFNGMIRRDIVLWNCMITGYVENGENWRAIEMFRNMDCVPDCVTLVSLLKACGNVTSLIIGQLVHAEVCRLGLEQDELVSSALVAFYGKCGRNEIGEEVFNKILLPGTGSWNALIAGYASLGDRLRVFNLVNNMQEEGLQMDSVTFVSILTACSHAGMIDEGKRYFARMPTVNVEHYNILVDMLGRANRLEEALSIVRNMPFEPDSVTWKTLLSACWKWNNLVVGRVAYNAIVARNTKDGAAYVMMREIYENSNI